MNLTFHENLIRRKCDNNIKKEKNVDFVLVRVSFSTLNATPENYTMSVSN